VTDHSLAAPNVDLGHYLRSEAFVGVAKLAGLISIVSRRVIQFRYLGWSDSVYCRRSAPRNPSLANLKNMYKLRDRMNYVRVIVYPPEISTRAAEAFLASAPFRAVDLLL
jgi:hypothetical protein